MFRIVLCIVALLSINGQAYGLPIQLTSVRITESGHEPGNSSSVCAGFTLTASKVESFFSTAEVITRHQEHYEYVEAPCYVRGTAKLSGTSVKWEIRAAGTGRVTRKDGSVLLLGDPKQKLEVPTK